MAISAINLLLDEALPEGLRDPHRIYDAKGVNALMSEVAKRHPELYPKLTKLLGDVGRKQAWRRGETFRMHDFNPVADRNALWQELDARESEVAGIEDPKTRAEARGDLYEEMSSRLQKETNTAALAAKNNIAMSVLSGARGKEAQLRDLIASPGFFPDGKGGVVPGFVRNSYAEGLRPYEFLSSSFSSRAAITESKKATAKGGFLAKTLARAMATEYVSAPDCGTSNGIDLPTDEKDIRGRILQRETAGYPAGTVIDRKVMSRLQQEKLDTVIVRSPLSCNAEHGVCGKCFGVKANGRFPKVGEHVGITASNALGEPMAQSALSMKHLVSGKGKAREYSGLDFINQFVESPEEFKEKAAVSPVNGHVDAIRPAPQGGNYVVVGAHEVYVPLDREVTAKVGDALEAGDQLSDGLLDVEDVLAHRGLGEARRYWSDRMGAMAAASGAAMDRRLFETLAKSVVDHVELDDPEEEGFLPDDKVRYSRWLHRRNLPATPVETKLREATGKYLEQPALHYTVGTKLTPRMLDHLDKNGIPKVYVSDKEPSFRPTFVRLQQVAATDDDWLASLGGSYLGANLGQGVMRAQDTNILENIHPVPRLAVGVGYGDKLEETGKF